MYVCIYMYICVVSMVLFVSVEKKKIGFQARELFSHLFFFEVKKMKSRKFEIIYMCLCSHQSSEIVSGGPTLNNGTQYPAEKLNVWRLKKTKYILYKHG